MVMGPGGSQNLNINIAINPQQAQQVLNSLSAQASQLAQQLGGMQVNIGGGGFQGGGGNAGGHVPPGVGAGGAAQAVQNANQAGVAGGAGGGGGGTPNIPNPVQHPGNQPSANSPQQYSIGATSGRVRGTFRGSGGEVLALEAGYGVARVVGSGLDYAAHQTAQGGNDIAAQYRLGATAISTAIGIGAGIVTGNPLVGAAAAGIAGTVLNPLADYLSAPETNRQSAAQSLTPFTAAAGGANGRDYITGRLLPHTDSASGRYHAGVLERITNISNARNPGYNGERQGTVQDTAAVYGAAASAIFASGNDPFAFSEHYRDKVDPYGAYRPTFDPRNKKPGFQLMNALIDGAGTAIINHSRTVYDQDEGLAETYTRRVNTLFGTKNAPAAMKRVAPIFAGLPDTGDNPADLLSRYGAEDTLDYLRLQNDQGTTPIDPMLLSRASAGVRTGARLAKRAATQARGRGAGMESAITGEMSFLADVPGGKDSDTYAQLAAQRRSARSEKWGEDDYLNYGQKMLGLETDAAVHQALPYESGWNMGNALKQMGLRAGQMATLSERYTQGMKNPKDFGIDQQRDTYEKYQGLRVNQAQDVAVLAEGGEDRMMLMAAGRGGASMARLDSEQLAASAVYQVGSPRRSHGAVNGQQLAMQNAFLHKYDTPDFNAGYAGSPKDRMTSMDSTLLAEIRDILKGMGGNGGGKYMGSTVHAGEARGMANAALGLQDITGMPPAHTN